MGFFDFVDDVIDVVQTVARVPGAVVSVIYDEITDNKSYTSSNSSYAEKKELEERTKKEKIDEINKDIKKFKIDSENLIKNKYTSVDIQFNTPLGGFPFNFPNQSKELVSITDFEIINQEKAIAILEEDLKEIKKLINIFQKEKTKCNL